MTKENIQNEAKRLFEDGWKTMGNLTIYHSDQGAANLRPEEGEIYQALARMSRTNLKKGNDRATGIFNSRLILG